MNRGCGSAYLYAYAPIDVEILPSLAPKLTRPWIRAKLYLLIIL
jgi:hypothetical protein